MSEKLKPCPFCGSIAQIERYGNTRRSTIYQCQGCSCSLETCEEWGHGKIWNIRADIANAEADARVEAAERAMRERCAELEEQNAALKELCDAYKDSLARAEAGINKLYEAFTKQPPTNAGEG